MNIKIEAEKSSALIEPKFYVITLASNTAKVVTYTGVHYSLEEARESAIEQIEKRMQEVATNVKENGGWRYVSEIMITAKDMEQSFKERMTEAEKRANSDLNRLMRSIIKSGDRLTLEMRREQFTPEQLKYLEEKIHAKEQKDAQNQKAGL